MELVRVHCSACTGRDGRRVVATVTDHPAGVEIRWDGGILVGPDDAYPKLMEWNAQCPTHDWLDGFRYWALIADAIARGRDTGKVQHVALPPLYTDPGDAWINAKAPQPPPVDVD